MILLAYAFVSQTVYIILAEDSKHSNVGLENIKMCLGSIWWKLLVNRCCDSVSCYLICKIVFLWYLAWNGQEIRDVKWNHVFKQKNIKWIFKLLTLGIKLFIRLSLKIKVQRWTWSTVVILFKKIVSQILENYTLLSNTYVWPGGHFL